MCTRASLPSDDEFAVAGAFALRPRWRLHLSIEGLVVICVPSLCFAWKVKDTQRARDRGSERCALTVRVDLTAKASNGQSWTARRCTWDDPCGACEQIVIDGG